MTDHPFQSAAELERMGVKIIREIDSYRYAGRFEVVSYLVQLPSGTQTTFFLRRGNPFALIIPELDDGSLVMVKQFRIGSNRISLEFPMGEVAGATHEEAAPIELKEETGYTAQRFDHIGSYFLSPGWSTQEGHIYHATGLTAGTAEPEEFEFVDPVVVTVDQLQEHLDSGDISDASTITAFDRFQRTVLAQRS